MAITAKSVYRDAGYFLRNQFVPVLLLSLLCALISTLLIPVFSPPGEQVRALADSMIKTNASSPAQLLQSLNQDQHRLIVRIVNVSNLALLVGNVLLTGGLLALIRQVSAGVRVSALRAVGLSVPELPRLFVLLFLMTLLAEIGALFLVVPGVLLAMLLALAPVILIVDKRGIFPAMFVSARLAWRHLWLVAPVVLLWVFARVLVKALLVVVFLLSGDASAVTAVLVNLGGNLLSAALLIYLFRLYTLLKDSQ